mmetsp:Transcript_22522/g.36494  ORF Transcript_22522/g.36494 Transcript_22522/m.36494 type:complete len:122 (-) Transcript_22522:646-1011(-)
MWSFINFCEPDLVFAAEAVSAEKLAKISAHIESRVLGKVLELAEPENVLQFYLEELPNGGHGPEMYLCLQAWMNRSLDLDEKLEHATSMLSHEQFIKGLRVFYDQLKNSAIAKELIKEEGV